MVVSESSAGLHKAAPILAAASLQQPKGQANPGSESACGQCCANLAALLSPRATAFAHGLCVVSALPGAATSDTQASMMALGCGAAAKVLNN